MYMAPPADFAGADDIITNLAKEREPFKGLRSTNVLSNPVLIITSFHIQLFQLTLSDQNKKAKRQDRNVLWDYFL